MTNEQMKSSVMIVDDHKLNLNALFNLLQGDYNVIAVESGAQALLKAHEHAPDIILMDIVMPDMNGFEVLKRLKDSSDTVDIPVIFITGLASPADEANGLIMGAVDYIARPFNDEVVKARVRTHLAIAKQMRLIEHLGMIDALTEIANRRRFDKQLEIEWARAKREHAALSMLMIDIDDFKSYNDAYGHVSGDALLQTITRTMTSCLKRPSDLAARIGGEEFAVLLPGTNIAGAAFVGEKIRAAIEKLNIPSGKDPAQPITISVGADSIVPDIAMTSACFVQKCDKYLYAAKRLGKNRLVYRETPDAKA